MFKLIRSRLVLGHTDSKLILLHVCLEPSVGKHAKYWFVLVDAGTTGILSFSKVKEHRRHCLLCGRVGSRGLLPVMRQALQLHIRSVIQPL